MSELQQYIEDVLTQIEKGKGKHAVWGSVYFDIATTKKEEKGGKVGVKIVDLKGGLEKESVSRVKFAIRMREAHGESKAF